MLVANAAQRCDAFEARELREFVNRARRTVYLSLGRIGNKASSHLRGLQAHDVQFVVGFRKFL
eukprot:13756724-Heterocapsa_arctica.AAC.1